jgi:hypothetical protein
MLPKLEKIANVVQEIQMGHCKCEKDGIICPLYYKHVNSLPPPLLVGKNSDVANHIGLFDHTRVKHLISLGTCSHFPSLMLCAHCYLSTLSYHGSNNENFCSGETTFLKPLRLMD